MREVKGSIPFSSTFLMNFARPSRDPRTLPPVPHSHIRRNARPACSPVGIAHETTTRSITRRSLSALTIALSPGALPSALDEQSGPLWTSRRSRRLPRSASRSAPPAPSAVSARGRPSPTTWPPLPRRVAAPPPGRVAAPPPPHRRSYTAPPTAAPAWPHAGGPAAGRGRLLVTQPAAHPAVCSAAPGSSPRPRQGRDGGAGRGEAVA